MTIGVVKKQNDYLEDNNQYFIDNEYCYYDWKRSHSL